MHKRIKTVLASLIAIVLATAAHAQQQPGQPPAKAHLPVFHPDEQQGQSGCRGTAVLISHGIAAHIGPEVEQTQCKRQAAGIVRQKGRSTTAAQQVDSLFGQGKPCGYEL